MAIIFYFIQLYSLLIFIRVLMSWFSVDPHNPAVETLCQLTDPYLDIFRKIIPSMGGMDFSPIIALFVLQFIGKMFLVV